MLTAAVTNTGRLINIDNTDHDTEHDITDKGSALIDLQQSKDQSGGGRGYCDPGAFRLVKCLACTACSKKHWIPRTVTPPLIPGTDEIDQSVEWDDDILGQLGQHIKRLRRHYRRDHNMHDENEWPQWIRRRNKKRQIQATDPNEYKRQYRAIRKAEAVV